MKQKLSIAAGVLALAVSSASAAVCVLTPSGSVGGAPIGVARVNFDNLTPLPGQIGGPGGIAMGPSGQVTVNVFGSAGVVSGGYSEGIVDFYAPPFLSGGNGLGFGPGGSNQGDGPDATPYLKTGLATVAQGDSAANRVELIFPGPQTYMGLLWGSVDGTPIDGLNTLTFYNNGTLVGTVTGQDVLAGANGDQGVNGTLYVNIVSTCPFTRVVASSGFTTFEFDNVAYNLTPPCTGCTYTQGWYKNHASDWPTLPGGVLTLGSLGNTYTKAELLSIYNQPVKGNGLVSLAHQLITAKLNILRGTCVPAGVQAAITAADNLILGLRIPPVGNGSIHPSMTSALVDILAAYNEGTAPGGPSHCN